MRIVLTGSGSGGHFYPLMAIAEALREEATARSLMLPELYLMAPDPYDSGSLFAHDITYVHVPAGKVRRYLSVRNITDAAKTFWGTLVALWKLFVLYPDVVMSKGSYTSLPVIIAAFLLRIPIVIHESDARPGRANRIAAPVARRILTAYEKTNEYFSGTAERVGIPIRKNLAEPYDGDLQRDLGFTPDTPLIFVIGGSQGAERVNDLIITALDELLPEYTIFHQTGEDHLQIVTETAYALTKDRSLLERYHARGFLDATAMSAAYSTAALVLSRAGSTSIYEIALHAKPSILIPIPEEISHDQRTNAYEYARTGAASVMEERNLTPHLLAAEIRRIMSDQAVQAQMQHAARSFVPPRAAETIAGMLIEIASEHA